MPSMRAFRRLRERFGGADQPDPRKALYVHLAWDGAILVIRADTGEQMWTDRGGLDRELRRTSERGGAVVYSREHPDRDPLPEMDETFERIVGYGLAMMLVEEPHPEALAPPARRRTILREADGAPADRRP
jgi:hypothetical protein